MSEIVGRILGYLVIFFGWFIAAYLAASFVAWNLNLSQWDELARVFPVLFAAIATALSTLEPRR